jgi:anti-sigma factor RsiW
MTRYDPDLISALAAGRLAPDEAAALEKEIAGDARAAAELAAHRLTLDTIHGAPTPVLSAEERTELHGRVAAALHLEDGAATRVVAPQRRVPWRPLAVAAAALAVMAGIVPLVGLLSMDGDDVALTTQLTTEVSPRNGAEETATPAATVGDAADVTENGDSTADLLSAESWEVDASKAVESLLVDPAGLIAAAEDGLTTCAQEAADLLGETAALSGAPFHLDTGDAVIWFISPDGTTLESVAIFASADCALLAVHP